MISWEQYFNLLIMILCIYVSFTFSLYFSWTEKMFFQMLFAYNKRNLLILIATKIQLCRKFQQEIRSKCFSSQRHWLPGLLYITNFLLTKVIYYWFLMPLTTYETVTICCTIWGFHVYRNTWQLETHCTEPLSDKDVTMSSFLYLLMYVWYFWHVCWWRCNHSKL